MSARPGRAADLALLPAGFAIAFFASWCGIGGGLFAVPLLHYGFGIELRRAVATALALVLGTTVAATATELAQPGSSLVPALVLALLAGVFVGARLGFAVSERLAAHALRKAFVVVLLLASARVLYGGGHDAAPAATAREALGALELVWAGAIGVGGGFLAPLLGVGGGLLMVPALYLVFPELGFEGARASSLAAAILGAARGLWLHARRGRVDARKAASLGLGALAGASAGVLALEHWRLFTYGRILLGVVLCLVAVRFLVDVRRGSASAPAASPD